MTLEELQTLQSLAQNARQEFTKELIEGNNNYLQLRDKTGLSLKQLYRIVNDLPGQPKFETLIGAYIKLLKGGK